jgi:hypothetical protein
MLCDLDRINNLLIPPLAHCEKGTEKFAHPRVKNFKYPFKNMFAKTRKT